jgi:hypothetical protein
MMPGSLACPDNQKPGILCCNERCLNASDALPLKIISIHYFGCSIKLAIPLDWRALKYS